MTTTYPLGELTRATSRRDRAAENFMTTLMRAFEAGAPQREIARAIGVTQPAVSQMIAAERARRMSVQGPVGSRLAEHQSALRAVAAAHGARRLRVFGSVAEGRDTAESDLDLLVSMPRTAGMFEVAALGDALADTLGAPVDVTAEHMVKADQLAALKRRAIPL